MNERQLEYLKKEARVREWIETVLRDDLELDLSEALSNGILLCHLLLKLDSTLIPSIHYGGENSAYKYRENIEFFVQGMEEYGVAAHLCFHPVDLIKQRNMPKVINSLINLGKVAERKGYKYPLPPSDTITPPDETVLSESHKKLLRKIENRIMLLDQGVSTLHFRKLPGDSTPPVTPKSANIKGVVAFQAVVRGFLVRKRIMIQRRHNAYRSRVANEILETEIKYVNALGTCIHEFLGPLQNALKGQAEKDVPVLDVSTIRTIFSDLKMIHTFHMQSVLKVIFLRVESWNLYQCLGDIFLQIMSLMKIYTQYISNYSNSTSRLRELQEDPQWVQWKQATEQRIGGMTLSSFLIMPVQRVPRYILLLRDLFKHTWADHPDYANLQKAATGMEELTQFLESKKKESENLNRLARLAAVFKGKIDVNLVEAHRKFIREDKFSGTTLYLFNDLIILCEYKEEEKRRASWSGLKRSQSSHSSSDQRLKHDCFWLDKLEVFEVDTGFQLQYNHAVIADILASPEEKGDWLASFNETKAYNDTKLAKQPKKAPKVRASLGVTLTRADSLQSLQSSLEMLQNHIESLDSQSKTVKNKKEKKQIAKLKTALHEQAMEVDKKVSAKVEERKLRNRAELLKEAAASLANANRSSSS